MSQLGEMTVYIFQSYCLFRFSPSSALLPSLVEVLLGVSVRELERRRANKSIIIFVLLGGGAMII